MRHAPLLSGEDEVNDDDNDGDADREVDDDKVNRLIPVRVSV
jgi:hypothetical protein